MGGRAGQSTWVMTPAAVVQMSPPVGLPVTVVPKVSGLPSVIHTVTADPQPVTPPLNPRVTISLHPGSMLHPVHIPASSSLVFTTLPHHKRLLPYKLNFDPSLMFLHSHGAVGDWLSGGRGVLVPGADVALPYLPPFVSSLSTLSVLLRSKNSLTKSSLRLLSQGLEPRHSQAKPKPRSSAAETTQSPDLLDLPSELTSGNRGRFKTLKRPQVK